jgi:hypothetical protein
MIAQHYEREALEETLTAALLRLAPAGHRFTAEELAPRAISHRRMAVP